MPYPGVDDSDTKWMEKCTSSVMETGKDKSSAIAICRSQLKKKKESNSELDLVIDEEVVSTFNKYREKYLRDTKSALNVDERTAMGMFLVHLARNNYNIP